jgi:AcrR family transcriptional regulator
MSSSGRVEVQESPRERLLSAMLDELEEKGFRDVSVGAVLRAAGLSEADFEKEFGDKDECLFAVYDFLAARLVERATMDCNSREPWPKRIATGLTALLEELATKPEVAEVVTRSFPGNRPSTYQRYVDLLARFKPLLREGREYSGLTEELSAEVETLAVGAAEAIIFSEIDTGRASRLPTMVPEILFSVLVPFMGPARAADEMRIALADL